MSLAIEAGGRDVTAACRTACSTTPPVEARISPTGTATASDAAVGLARRPGGPAAGAPRSGSPRRPAVQGFSWDETTKISRLTRAASATPLVLDFTTAATRRVRSAAPTSARPRTLSVEEIVARNQQAQAAQANAFRTFIASLRIELHFRPTATQVFDVVSENRFFFAPDTRRVGGAIVFGERREVGAGSAGTAAAASREGADAAARSAPDGGLSVSPGTDRNGRRAPCYVVAFEPNDPAQSRYRGWVWIDAERSCGSRCRPFRPHLEGPIVSNEEITFYAPVSARRGRPVCAAEPAVHEADPAHRRTESPAREGAMVLRLPDRRAGIRG